MNLRKNSILIALCIGNGYIAHQTQIKNGKKYQCNYLEINHRQDQKDYIEWKAKLCKSVTGKKCSVREKHYNEKNICGRHIVTPGYTFTCTAKYFKILRKWLYPNGQKKLDPKYLNYLDPQGLAIWYCDNGSTYISKKRKKDFSIEISTCTTMEEADSIIEFFNKKWNIKFHKHRVNKKEQYNIRAFSSEALKFLKLIEPYTPDCMAYKLIVPKFYFQECLASHIKRISGMKIYSEQ